MNDKEIIKKILDGHDDLFKYIIDKYKYKVFNIIYSFCGYTSDCDDIAQNVFIKIFRSLSKFKFESAFSTWMYRIVINESITAAKKRNNKVISLDVNISNDDDSQNNLIDFIKSDDDTERQAIQKEAQKLVQTALLKLQDNYRMVLTLRDIENFSYEEIANVMNVSTERIKVWIFRARMKLREILSIGGNLL